MAIFTEEAIKFFNKKLFVIFPFNENLVTGVGYDLTIGFYIKISQKKMHDHGQVDFTKDERIDLNTGESLLIVCNERIFFSNRIAGSIHCRGSYASKGLVLNATTVDPLWNGRMVFLVTNIAGHSVSIPLKEHFATIMIQKTYLVSKDPPKSPKQVLLEFTAIYQPTGTIMMEASAFAYEGDHKKKELQAYEKEVFKVINYTGDNFIYQYSRISWFLSRRKDFRNFIICICLLGAITFLLLQLDFGWFNNMSDETQKTIGTISALVGIVAPAIGGLAFVVKLFKKGQKA